MASPLLATTALSCAACTLRVHRMVGHPDNRRLGCDLARLAHPARHGRGCRRPAWRLRVPHGRVCPPGLA